MGLNNSDINSLVAWRNPINDATATTYTNYVYSATTNAFLTPAPGERMFTSRQQLIDFLTQNVAGNNPARRSSACRAHCPDLTTFSRELNEPCWYPQTNMAAAGYSYSTTATTSANYTSASPSLVTNAFAPLERATAIYTNSSGLVCNPNQPVACSRFLALGGCAWLGTNGPANGATAAQIQQSFGLVWDSADYAWQYVGSALPLASDTTVQASGRNPPHRFLAEAKPREPNYFELLKAAILSGSVGATPAAQFGTIPSPGGVDPRYAQYDQQTMQIDWP